MFQYAAGRALSEKHHVPLKLDLSYLKREWLERLKGNPIRHYSLNIFNIQEDFAKTSELPPLAWFPGTRLAKTINCVSKLMAPNAPTIIREIPFNLAKNITQLHNASSHIYLDGFWQNEEYFRSIREIILREFTFTSELEGRNLELANQITATNSISIHIRRKEYIQHPVHSRFFSQCGQKYFQTCISFMEQQIVDPHFFVFGDDPKWAKKYLKSKHPITFVEHNLKTNHYYEDIRLTSLCQHNIISNSTFCWWAAYFNQNPQKIVLAPKPWFKAKINNTGLIQPSWIEIGI